MIDPRDRLIRESRRIGVKDSLGSKPPIRLEKPLIRLEKF